MGECCGVDEENYYKIGKELIVVEEYTHCENCGTAHIQIHRVKDKDFEKDAVELGTWDPDEKGEHIVITASDFFSTIKRKLKDAFGEYDSDKLNLNKYEDFKKFIKLFWNLLRESDNDIKEGWNVPTYDESGDLIINSKEDSTTNGGGN